MIGSFESTARTCPDRTFFLFSDEAGRETCFTYRKARLIAATMARRLREMGVRSGDCIAVDLPSCPEYVFLVLAAAYGSFSLVALNNHLSDAKKTMRLMELARGGRVRTTYRIDEDAAARLLHRACADLAGRESPQERVAARARADSQPFGQRVRVDSQAQPPRAQRQRIIMGARQDAEEDAIHFAERAAHLFDADALALVMFTSGAGTGGAAKAVPLSWRQLAGAARAANSVCARRGAGLWQAALPLYHIRGFQVMARSVCNGSPFALYREFDPARVLRDAPRLSATHIGVTDVMLKELLDTDAAALSSYQCVLLGGGPPNPGTLRRALAAGVRVQVSYGMTEAAGHLAQSPASPASDGGLRLLPGYTARIVDEDAGGYGRLAVRGPGLFDGYLNAQAARTVDGFFLTGDTAALHEGRIYLKDRTDDMFASGGESVYPAYIVEQLLKVPGVRDACVLGVKDPQWGYRPVAFVERDEAAFPGVSPQQYAEQVKGWLAGTLPRAYRPEHVAVLRTLPRMPDGTPDTAALARMLGGVS